MGSKETTPETVPVGPLCIQSIFQAEIAEVINPLHIKEAKNIIASKIYEQTNKPPTFVQQNQEMSKAPIQYDPATGKILHYFHNCISLARPYSSPRSRWHEYFEPLYNYSQLVCIQVYDKEHLTKTIIP